MTWSLSASGHFDDDKAEADLVDKLRDVFKDVQGTANMYTQYQGQVNLKGASQDSGTFRQPASGLEARTDAEAQAAQSNETQVRSERSGGNTSGT